MLYDYLQNTLAVLAELAPWFILGLFFAGLIRWLLPDQRLAKLLGNGGINTVTRATLLGAPLPLCSCGVLPAAIGLRRQGLSKPGTVSFLIATPQNGVDSLAVTYALLGPLFTIVRLITSLISAFSAGLATLLVTTPRTPKSPNTATTLHNSSPQSASPNSAPTTPTCCCPSTNETEPKAVSLNVLNADQPPTPPTTATSCCSSKSPAKQTFLASQKYAFGKLFNDLAPWLALGVAVAGAMNTIFSPGDIASFGSGILPMLAVVVISIPLYVCASASTPIAASLIAAGASPGLALAFLLVGPATNFAGVMLINKELGTKVTAVYLATLTITTLALASLVDTFAPALNLTQSIANNQGFHLIPPPVALGSSAILLILTLRLATKDLLPARDKQSSKIQTAPTHA